MANIEYIPVACAQHEIYQYAVLKRTVLDLSWRDEGGVMRRRKALPIDVVTRDKAEFLVLEHEDGSVQPVRLDRIVEAYSVTGGECLQG